MLFLAKVHLEKIERMIEIDHAIKKGQTEVSALIIPTLIITIPLEQHDDNHRSGFSVTVCQKTYTPLKASFYKADGIGTYRESNLTEEELEDLKKYYAKYFTDMWSKFTSCIIK